MPEREATLLAHDVPSSASGDVVPPIHQTSLFTFESYAQMRATVSGDDPHPIYSRGHNPTVAAFEEKVARLEGAESARAFSSGMGAISTAVLAHCGAGDRVVCVRHVYPDAYKLFTGLLPRFGVGVEFVDGRDLDAVVARLDGARLLYLENPSSLLFELQDVAALCDAAHARGVTVMLDNSWASPLYQKPLELGVDLVVHSASKYLSGHSDVVAGVLAGSRATLQRLNALEYPVLGAKLSPFEGWLLLRGLRTLRLRLDGHAASALHVARFLRERPQVARVHYPALDDHPQHALFRQQFRAGSGLLSFELTTSDEADIARFVDALELFHLGVSWGGFESLVYPAAIGYAAPGPSAIRDFGVPRSLVRLHVGLEDPDDLLADLAAALERLERG